MSQSTASILFPYSAHLDAMHLISRHPWTLFFLCFLGTSPPRAAFRVAPCYLRLVTSTLPQQKGPEWCSPVVIVRHLHPVMWLLGAQRPKLFSTDSEWGEVGQSGEHAAAPGDGRPGPSWLLSWTCQGLTCSQNPGKSVQFFYLCLNNGIESRDIGRTARDHMMSPAQKFQAYLKISYYG